MKDDKEKSPAAAGEITVALRRIFGALARLLIARSMPYPFVANLLRNAYIDVAVEQFPVAGKPQTDSRITLLTGIHRKDVKRQRGLRREAASSPRAASLGSQLIARWTSLPEYLDAQAGPKPLPRVPTDGKGASFESLVRSLNTDIRPRVVLDEWLRLGIVHIDDEDRVCLNVAAFVPPQGSEEMAYYFGRNLRDHVAAAVHNMLGGTDPFFERSVNYNNLSAAAVSELTALAKERGMQVLQEINARALELQRRDSGQPGSSLRMNVGLYLFSEDEADPADGVESDD